MQRWSVTSLLVSLPSLSLSNSIILVTRSPPVADCEYTSWPGPGGCAATSEAAAKNQRSTTSNRPAHASEFSLK